MRIKSFTPSPLVRPEERRTGIVLVAPTRVRLRLFHLLVAIVQLVSGNLWLWLRRQFTPRQRARRLREFAERMGYLWVKIGQLMAMRNDMYPDDFCNELDKLQFPNHGLPFATVTSILEAELGQPLTEAFAEFDPTPFRAGFTYQIHRATLPDSEDWVAVKVQRPDIEAIFRQDMAAFRWLVALFKMLGLFRHIQWDNVIWELEQVLVAEIDYGYEAANLRRMRKIMLKRKIYVPRVHGRLSTRRVLVMEFVRGALLSDFVLIKNTDPKRLDDWLAHNNIDPRRLGQRLFACFLRQLVEDNLVHGNLNPGNIVVLRDGRFALVDLSVLFTVESDFMRNYVQSLRALATYQYGRSADLTLLLSPELPVIDLTSLKERMVRCFRAWDARSELRQMPQHDKSLASLYRELSRVLSAARITPTQTFMKIAYTWSTLDDSLCLLLPSANFGRMFRKHFQAVRLRAYKDAFRGGGFLEMVFNLRDNLGEYHQLLGSMLRRSALVFQGGTSKLSEAMASLFRFLRLASFGVVTFCFLKLLDIHFVNLFDDTPIDRHLENVSVDADILVLVIVVVGYLFFMCGRLERRFRQEDVRLPNTSTASFGR